MKGCQVSFVPEVNEMRGADAADYPGTVRARRGGSAPGGPGQEQQTGRDCRRHGARGARWMPHRLTVSGQLRHAPGELVTPAPGEPSALELSTADVRLCPARAR